MAIGYPNTLDTFPNPTSSTKRNAAGFELDVVISNLGDAAEALEQEVGVRGSALAGGLSPLINGGVDVWQDGVTFTSIANGAWGPDNWIYSKVGAVVHDLLRSTDVPTYAQSLVTPTYSLHLDVTTADASIAAGDLCTIATRIEGSLYRHLYREVWSIGFWVKAAATGVHCVYVRNAGNDVSCVLTYSILVADTWEYKTVTVPAHGTGGTWDFANGRGIEIGWTLAAGSTFQTTAGAWAGGNFLASSAQVNEAASTAFNFRLAMVGRPTLGTVPARWVPPDPGIELYRCKRYNEVMGGIANSFFGSGYAASTTLADFRIPIVPKRAAAPSFGALSGTIGNFSVIGSFGAAALTAIADLAAGADNNMVRATVAAGMTAGHGVALYAPGTDKLRIQSRLP